MDINVLRGIIAAVSLVVFLGIVIWAWSGRQRKRFEEASRLPFTERDEP
jgi:cytochrome c oxidase cbb3-type subunit 4